MLVSFVCVIPSPVPNFNFVVGFLLLSLVSDFLVWPTVTPFHFVWPCPPPSKSLGVWLIFVPCYTPRFFIFITNSCSRSVNLWSENIPGRSDDSLKDLPVLSEIQFDRAMSKVDMKSSKTVVGFLTHFVDRGLFSKQPYVAEGCNHRDCKVSYWTSVPSDKRFTMIDSLTEVVDDSCHFDSGGQSISVYFHGVTESDHFDVVKLRSANRLAYSQSNKYGYARNRAVSVLSGKQFHRLVNFMGYRWTSSDGSVKPEDAQPSFEDIISVCNLIVGYDFSTHDGFKRFYDDFGFSGVFTYANDTPIWVLNEMFGILFRSYVPVRITAFDGQHRLLLMALFMAGYLKPSTSIPLEQVDWEQSRFSDKNYSKMQTFTEMAYTVGIPMSAHGPEKNIKVVVSKLFDAGNLVTEASHHAQDPTWQELFQKWVHLAFSSDGFTSLNFDNYWSRSQNGFATSRANGEILFAALTKLLSSQPRFAKCLYGEHASETKKLDMTASLEESLKKPDSMTKNSNIIQRTREMIEMFRCAVETKDGRNSLVAFFEATEPQQVQRTSNMSDFYARFHNEVWLRRNVMGSVEKVVEHAAIRFQLERHIMGLLRKGSVSDRALQNGLSDCKWKSVDIDNWPSKVQFAGITVAGVKKICNLDSKAGNTEKMFNHGFMAGLISDIFRTIHVYGFDPDFLVRPTMKHNQTEEQKLAMNQFKTNLMTAQAKVIADFKSKGYKQVNELKDPCLLEYQLEPEDDDEEEDENEDPKPKTVKYHCYYDVQEELLSNATDESDRAILLGFFANGATREYLE